MAHYNFRADLNVSKKTEHEIGALLEKNYNMKVLEYREDNLYDILVQTRDGRKITFEIKEDFMCEKTGNVSVEYSCRGKPSGIETTEADYYIYKVHTNTGIVVIMHSVNFLKKMIEKKIYFRTVNGGDRNSNSLNYLFKYDKFAKNGHILQYTSP